MKLCSCLVVSQRDGDLLCHWEGSPAIAKDLVTLWVNKFWILDFPGAEDKHENHKYVADFQGFSAFFTWISHE